MLKDKPLLAPFRVLQPTWFSSPARFPLTWAVGWWILTQALAWLEPVPEQLQIQFDGKYLASVHLCAMAAQLLLPFLGWFLVPRETPGGRSGTLVRLSLGAGLWFLWTFPLTFLFTSTQGALVLSLVRELLWAGALALGIYSVGLDLRRLWAGILLIGLITTAIFAVTVSLNSGLISLFWGSALSAIVYALKPQDRKSIGRWVWTTLGTLFFFVGSLVFATLPDLDSLARLRMDDMGSGRVCKGTPRLPGHRVETATWTVAGDPKTVSVERLSLGTRQVVLDGSPGRILLRVSAGAPPPPQDTDGTTRLDPADGPLLESLAASVPAGSDSFRLVSLHGTVHRSIRYERRYFPGTSSEILARGSGDCKAYAQVFCAAARRLGYPARVVHGLLASPDGYYAHAWVTVKTTAGWRDWDPTSSEPFPDARYLRFAPPRLASGAFDGELAIFALDSVSVSDATR